MSNPEDEWDLFDRTDSPLSGAEEQALRKRMRDILDAPISEDQGTPFFINVCPGRKVWEGCPWKGHRSVCEDCGWNLPGDPYNPAFQEKK